VALEDCKTSASTMIEVTVSMPMSKAEFGQNKLKFVQALADSATVTVVSVTETNSGRSLSPPRGRHLTATSIEVLSTIQTVTPDTIMDSLTVQKLNYILHQQEMTGPGLQG
jgi:hypothetical protein